MYQVKHFLHTIVTKIFPVVLIITDGVTCFLRNSTIVYISKIYKYILLHIFCLGWTSKLKTPILGEKSFNFLHLRTIGNRQHVYFHQGLVILLPGQIYHFFRKAFFCLQCIIIDIFVVCSYNQVLLILQNQPSTSIELVTIDTIF